MDTTSDYVVGVDFGTLSGRAVVVRVADGQELGSAVHDYFGRGANEVMRRLKTLRREVRQ